MSYIRLYRSNDRVLAISAQDSGGVAIDITGASLFFYVSKSNGRQVIFEKSVGNGITVVDAVGGEIEIEITNADSDLVVGDYHYELLLVDVDGNRYTVLQGTLEITHSIGGV